MSKAATPLEPLFKDLDDLIHKDEYEKAIEVCNNILVVEPTDVDALHAKVICLLNLDEDNAEKALKLLGSNNELASKLSFERAYGLYRVKKLKEALTLLEDEKIFPLPKSKRVLELQAQVYYKMENYKESAQIYERVVQEHGIKTFEILTNLLAACALGGLQGDVERILSTHKNFLQSNFEFAYNAACGSIEGGDYATAEKFLLLAQKSCKDSLADSSTVLQEELSGIYAQLGYIRQMQGKTEEALDFYNRALKSNPNDESIVAVATNNIVSLGGSQQDLPEAVKKLRHIASTAEQKLSTQQRTIIGFNRCLLLAFMDKANDSKELVKNLQEQFPDSERFPLILSALFYKEKKADQSKSLLEEFARQHPDSLLVQLSIAQLCLEKGNFPLAISALEAITSLRNKPAYAATLVSLYEKVNNVEGAIKVLDELISSYESQKTRDPETFAKILRESGSFKLRYKRYRDAAADLEKVMKINKNDMEAMASLVIAYSQFDPKHAEAYGIKLPKLVGQKENIDAEKLENFLPRLKTTKDVDTKVAPKSGGKGEVAGAKKHKKKKKLPKDPSKPLDPERWIPLKQRSYYKKRGRRIKGGGGQGAQAVGRSVQQEKAKEAEKAATAPETKPEAQPPAKPKQQQHNKKNKGKKKR